MATIMLATDGSDHARMAAERAVRLAEERGATLHVLCVVDRRKFNEPALSADELAAIVAEDHGFHCVQEVTKMAEGTGVTVEGDVRHGVPHEAILDYAEVVGAEPIVVGEHGEHTGHFGGVGRRVARLADREVLVVSDGPEARS